MGRTLLQQGDIYTSYELTPQPARPSFGLNFITVKLRKLFASFTSLIALLLIFTVTQPALHFQTLAATPKPEEDWTKCSIKPNGQPGTLNLSTTKNYSDSNERSDPKTLFGDYYASTDENEPFFTEHNANAEGRWAGNGRRDTGTPYWHGGPFRRDGTAPEADPSDAIRVGGFLYLNYQDKYRFDANGHEGAESNWNRVMRWTEDIMSGAGDGKGGWYKDNNPTLDPNGKWLDRNCVLNTQIFRLWNEYKANNNPGFGYDRESGFFVGAKGIKSVADVTQAQPSVTQAPTVSQSPTPSATTTPSEPTTTPSNTPTATPTGVRLGSPTPSATPVSTATPTPTMTVTLTPTPTSSNQSSMIQAVVPTNTTTFAAQGPVTSFVESLSSQEQVTSTDGDTMLEGTIGKDKNGKYFSPSAIVVNDQLYVFVVGEDGTAAVTTTNDGTSWNDFTNLSGTFTSPIRTSKLSAGNNDYVYALGTGTDRNTYFKSTNTQGDFASSWNTVNTATPQYASSTVQKEVRFRDHTYTFTTAGGQLKICVDKSICKAN